MTNTHRSPIDRSSPTISPRLEQQTLDACLAHIQIPLLADYAQTDGKVEI
jgi:hypothetical protein